MTPPRRRSSGETRNGPLRGLRVPALVAVLVGAGSTAPPGMAGPHFPSPFHTELVEAIPGEGETVEGPVEEILLRFSTPVQLALSSVTVLDEGGHPAPFGAPAHPPDGREDILVVEPTTPIEPGDYRVEWQTAGPDGHLIRGRYGFRVVPDGVADPAERPRPEADREAAVPSIDPVHEVADPLTGPLGTGARWLQLLSLALIVGTVAFRGLVLPFVKRRHGLEPAAEQILLRSWRLGLLAGVLGAVALPLLLWVQGTATFPAGGLDAGMWRTLLFATPWGAGWLLSAFGLGIFVGGLVLAAPRNGARATRGWLLAALGMLALPAGAVVSGHVWALDASPRSLFLGAFYLHVLAVGVWLGGLGHLVLAGLPGLRAARAEGETLAPGLSLLVNAFSRIALGAVAVLVATGSLTAWMLLDAPGSLFTTTYGRTLLAKLGVATLAFALGFYNWRVVRPSLEREASFSTLRIPASLELVLGTAVLLLTAILVVLPLP